MNSRGIWWKIILRLVICYLLVQLAPAVVVIASGIVFGPITTPDAAALWLPMWIHISNNYIYSLLFTPSVGVFEGTMVVGKATRDIIDAACVLTAVIVMGFLFKKNIKKDNADAKKRGIIVSR